MYSLKNLMREAVLNDIINIVKTYSEEEKEVPETKGKKLIFKILETGRAK